MHNNFPVTYWGADASTRVHFMPINELPSEVITSCFVAAVTEDLKIAIARPRRGWGLPGGHIEKGESPEECVRREAYEECGIKLGKLKIIGGWQAEKIKETAANAKYPTRAYQLLYLASIAFIKDNYNPENEILERKFIPINEFGKYHHNFKDYETIYNYICDMVEQKKDWLIS